MARRVCTGCGLPHAGNRAKCSVCSSVDERAKYESARDAGRGYGGSRVPKSLRLEVLKRDGYRCFYCGLEAESVDHLHPYSLGGESTRENLVACCVACNSSKGTDSAEVFLRSRDKRTQVRRQGDREE